MGAAIHVVGSMMIDRVSRVRALPRAGETVAAVSSATFAGGKGANQAAAAAKCGARVRMLGRGGPDSAFIVSALRDAGVGTWSISLDDPSAGAATVMVAENGENAIVIAPEANTRIALRDIERFLRRARQGDIVLFQNECACLHEGIAHAASRGLRVWLNAAPADPSLRALRFEKLAGLVVNETEAEVLTGERDPARALELLARWMPGGTVIVTLGVAGAIAAAGGSRIAHRGFAVDAVDTVGCGDAFVGGYLSAMAAGLDAPRALARANAAGALAAMREGAMPSLPSLAEVKAVEALPERSRLASRSEGIGGKPAACERCGYDISASELGDACPECGQTIRTSRFAGRWRAVRDRRRFEWSSWALLCAAALHALATVLLSIETPSQVRHGGIPSWLFLGGFMLVPLAMLAVAATVADAPRRVRLVWIASGLRAWGAALVVLDLAGVDLGIFRYLGLGRASEWIALMALVLGDLLFVISLRAFGHGTGVAPVGRRRWRSLVALAAFAALLAWDGDQRRFPILLFSVVSTVLVWSAIEVRGLAKRMRAAEDA